MRMLVTGCEGQLARALRERGPAHGVETIAVGRPGLDLAQPRSVEGALARFACDTIVNAAAYTAVDKAESEEELAHAVNRDGAEAVAAFAQARGLPLIHVSTDYVFDGRLTRPYIEEDDVAPLNAYGRSKLLGEGAVRSVCPAAVIFRTSWLYSPCGENFVRTMLRLGEARDHVSVVADQFGAPTSALDLADGILAAARGLSEGRGTAALGGVYHMTAQGEASWADFAEEIFTEAVRCGRKPVTVRRILARDYPVAASRPANSRLSNEKLARVFGVALPEWRAPARACVARLLGGAPL